MIVQNAAAETAKEHDKHALRSGILHDKQATVHVRQVSKESIYIWEMLLGDAKVADIRESTVRLT